MSGTGRGERGAVRCGFKLKPKAVPRIAVFENVKPHIAVSLRYGFAVSVLNAKEKLPNQPKQPKLPKRNPSLHRLQSLAISTSTNSSVHEDLLALSGNVETYKEAQKIKENAEKMKEANLKIKEKMQLRKIIQQDISGMTGFKYELVMEMKRVAARQLGFHINE
ncbi:hypothetical protein LXL04_006517 [Taraxacum kok-saghyz]